MFKDIYGRLLVLYKKNVFIIWLAGFNTGLFWGREGGGNFKCKNSYFFVSCKDTNKAKHKGRVVAKVGYLGISSRNGKSLESTSLEKVQCQGSKRSQKN